MGTMHPQEGEHGHHDPLRAGRWSRQQGRERQTWVVIPGAASGILNAPGQVSRNHADGDRGAVKPGRARIHNRGAAGQVGILAVRRGTRGWGRAHAADGRHGWPVRAQYPEEAS
jgi:hypothetical protein